MAVVDLADEEVVEEDHAEAADSEVDHAAVEDSEEDHAVAADSEVDHAAADEAAADSNESLIVKFVSSLSSQLLCCLLLG